MSPPRVCARPRERAEQSRRYPDTTQPKAAATLDLFTYADLSALKATNEHSAKSRRELLAEAREIRAEIRASEDPYEQDDLTFALELVLQQIRTLELSLA